MDVDNLFFPDAVKFAASARPPLAETSSELCPPSISAPITDPALYADGLSMPYNSALRATPGVDAAGEIGDSLTEEMLGDVLQDLEAPYRPNISSYDATSEAKAYSEDKATKVDAVIDESWKGTAGGKKYAEIHPSAATPAFQSLAIFTGALSCSNHRLAIGTNVTSRVCRRGRALRLPSRRLPRPRDVVRGIPPYRRMGAT